MDSMTRGVGAGFRRAAVWFALVAFSAGTGSGSVAIGATQARDNRPWNRAYKDGVAQMGSGRFAEAEASFRRALAADRAPDDRTKPVQFDNIGDRHWFLPEFYLAVAILNQKGREAEALGLLNAVLRDRKVGLSAKESTELPGLIKRAETAVAAAAAPAAPSPQPTPPVQPPASVTAANRPPPTAPPLADPPVNTPPATTGTGPPTPGRSPVGTAPAATVSPTSGTVPPPPTPPAAPRVDPVELLKQGRTALTARRYSDAKALARDASAAGAAPAAAALLKDIESAERLDRARASDDRDRAGMAAFFAGNYKEAIRRLEERLDGDAGLPGSSRALFYLACANAALAELPGENATERLNAARRFYQRIPSPADVERDLRYVSPKVRTAIGR